MPSVVEERANSHCVREVTERHVLLPMPSSCDWDEPDPVPTGSTCGEEGAEAVDPIMKMRDSDDEDGTTDAGDSGHVDDVCEYKGLAICGVSFVFRR